MVIRNILVCAWGLIAIGGCVSTPSRPTSAERPAARTATETAALAIVQRRIEAFNEHDIEGYLSTHHPHVRIYRYPDTLLGEGRAHLRRVFGADFRNEVGRIEVGAQSVVDGTVVSEEYLTLYGPPEHLIAVYTVVQGQIVSIRLIERPD